MKINTHATVFSACVTTHSTAMMKLLSKGNVDSYQNSHARLISNWLNSCIKMCKACTDISFKLDNVHIGTHYQWESRKLACLYVIGIFLLRVARRRSVISQPAPPPKCIQSKIWSHAHMHFLFLRVEICVWYTCNYSNVNLLSSRIIVWFFRFVY